MVTPIRYFDAAGVHQTAELFFGLSTDTKPEPAANGSCFVEMDAGKLYFYNAAGAADEKWIEWGAGSDSGTPDTPDTPEDPPAESEE